MRFKIQKTIIKQNIATALRRVGYSKKEFDEKQKEESFVRYLNRSGFPRFHLYVEKAGDNFLFNLHLDQKRPIYPHTINSFGVGVNKGAPAHQGEYDGQIIQREVERIKKRII